MNEKLSAAQKRKLEIAIARRDAARLHTKNQPKTFWQKIVAFFR